MFPGFTIFVKIKDLLTKTENYVYDAIVIKLHVYV